jgi:putative ABC transport system permease protein
VPGELYDWYRSRRDIREWYSMARRTPDASPAELQADLSRVAASTQARGGDDERIDVAVRDLHREVVDEAAPSLLLRFAGVGLVFLAICSNVSSLLLVRAEARRGELAARAAFGATRARLMRQVLTETLLLFLLAAPLSLLAASLMADAFRDYSIDPHSTLAQVNVTLDAKTVLFCLGTCLLAGLFSGGLPALAASRVDLFSVLKQAGSGAAITGSRTGLRAALVVTQVALAFTLSTSSGLALKALADTLGRPAGFEPEGLVTGRLMGVPPEYDQPVRRDQLYAQVMERIRTTPGVQSVAANVALPLSGYPGEFEFEIEGRPTPPARWRPLANRNVVTQNYFETLRIPVLQGRAFLAVEEADSAPVVIISKHLAEAFFPGENPIGRHIRHGGHEEPWREIVGVVGDVRRSGLAAPIRSETYLPIYPEAGAPVIVARTDHPAHLLEELPRVVASVDPVLGVWSRRLDERMQDTLLEAYRVSVVLGVFAAVALLLAALGLYALVSYTTALKTREFGIRMALGSPPRALVWRVMRSALVWLGLGSALGLLAALALGKALALSITGVHSFDLEVYTLVALSLGFTGALASFVPAWRTLRISPASALRYE